jgi:hypothetical protein
MSANKQTWKLMASRESALFLVLMFMGLVVLPASIYVVGSLLFGEYGGTGFSAFYGKLHSDLRAGASGVWFLVLSPYMVCQLLRITLFAFRSAGRSGQRIKQ